jgi:hypothetical protein
MDEMIKAEIDALTQEDACRIWRFAPPEHRFLGGAKDQETRDYFVARFKALGGFTPAISKRLGW